jgi:phage/plasmid-associated DNA primase
MTQKKIITNDMKAKFQYFSLEEFSRIYTIENNAFNEQLDKDIAELKDKMKTDKVPKISRKPVYTQTMKYYRDNVFKTIEGNYFVRMYNDSLRPFSSITFKEVFGNTIREINKDFLKEDCIRYHVDIFDEDFEIDHKSVPKRINIANKFNYSHTNTEFNQDIKDNAQTLIDDFLIKIICNGDKEVFKYLRKLVSAYLHRKQTETVFILVGSGGTGKSKFKEFLCAMIGQGAKMMTDQVLSGRDMFNSAMIGAVVGYIEETSGKGQENYVDIQKTLKRMSTEKYISVRKMHTDAYDVKNIINFLIITNHLKDIQMDRRNFILEPSCEHQEDGKYFAKITKLINDKKVMQYLFNYFYTIDCTDIVETKIPQTEVMQDFVQDKSECDPFYTFFVDEFIVVENSIKEATTNGIWDMYNEYVVKNGLKSFGTSGMCQRIFKHQVRQFLEKNGRQLHKTDLYELAPEKMMIKLDKKGWSKERIEERKQKYDELFEVVDYKPEVKIDIEYVKQLEDENLNLKLHIEKLQEQLKGYEEDTKQKKQEVVINNAEPVLEKKKKAVKWDNNKTKKIRVVFD